MTRATRWTDEKIKALKLPAGVSEKRILIEPGLYLHIRRRNEDLGKHWQYRAQVDGLRRWLSMGTYPGVSFARAREELLSHDRDHEAAKKGEGDHPALAARQARKAAKARPTVNEVFEEWLADKRMGSARKGGVPVRERTITILRENFDLDIRRQIGELKIAKLTRAAVQTCIDAPRRRGAPGAAAQVYRTLRGLVNFAIRRGHIDGLDPMRGIDNPRPYRPGPVNAASDAELVALFATLDRSAMWASTKLAIELQLLTGARPGEVRLATWAEIDRKRATWSISAERVKSGRMFRVHLSAPAIALLDRATALRGLNENSDRRQNDFLFPGANGGALEKMAVARALKRLTERLADEGGKDLRPHDLRRTFRTMLSRIGIPPHIAELCMNHQETETMRRVYDGHDYRAEMVEAWNKAGAQVGSIRAGGALVIPFCGRRTGATKLGFGA